MSVGWDIVIDIYTQIILKVSLNNFSSPKIKFLGISPESPQKEAFNWASMRLNMNWRKYTPLREKDTK